MSAITSSRNGAAASLTSPDQTAAAAIAPAYRFAALREVIRTAADEVGAGRVAAPAHSMPRTRTSQARRSASSWAQTACGMS